MDDSLPTIWQPLFYILRLVGLAPFTMTYNRSPRSTGYTIVLICALVYGTTRVAIVLFASFDSQTLGLGWFIPRMLMLCSSATCALVSLALAASTTRRQLRDVHRVQSSIDKVLSINKAIRKNEGRFYRVAIILQSVMIVTLITYEVVISTGSRTYVACRGFTFLVNCGTFLQFKDAVTYLKSRYSYINKEMLSTLDTMKLKSSNTTQDNLTTDLNLSKQTISSVKTLRVTHFELFQISEMINSVFGFQILFLISSFLVSTINYINVVISCILQITNSTIDAETMQLITQYVLVSVYWLSVHVLLLVDVAISCHLTIREANRTTSSVQKCLLVDNINSGIKLELKNFSYQLMNSKPMFTACDMFNLDMTLLLSIAATTTTYTIIMLGK